MTPISPLSPVSKRYPDHEGKQEKRNTRCVAQPFQSCMGPSVGQSTWPTCRTPRVNDTLTATGRPGQAAKKDFTGNRRTFHTQIFLERRDSVSLWSLQVRAIQRNISHHFFTQEYKKSQLPWWLSSKESACQFRKDKFNPWVRKIPWRKKWQPTPVSLLGISRGRRRLVGYSSWGHKQSDTT